MPTFFTGHHAHPTLGTFDYEVNYDVRQPASTWLIDWNGKAQNPVTGQTLELTGGTIELIVGSAAAAPLVLREQIAKEIEAL